MRVSLVISVRCTTVYISVLPAPWGIGKLTMDTASENPSNVRGAFFGARRMIACETTTVRRSFLRSYRDRAEGAETFASIAIHDEQMLEYNILL